MNYKYLSFKFLVFLTAIFGFRLHAETTFHFNFAEDHQEWIGDFADYPVGQEAFFELKWGWTNLPYPMPENEKGIVLSGNNHSDDLLMFIKRQVTGLEPNTEYELTFNVIIETKVPPAQFGIGGSPGESVYFKVGASSQEPVKVVRDNYYRLNVDVGSQSNGGVNGIVIGNLANSLVDPENPNFAPKEMSNSQTFKARTDDKGSLWILIGTDSAFEGSSIYYIANISVTACKV